jgi:hypothetical protein
MGDDGEVADVVHEGGSILADSGAAVNAAGSPAGAFSRKADDFDAFLTCIIHEACLSRRKYGNGGT